MISEVNNIDCMEYLRQCEDGAFDLAIVDPPYGIRDAGGQTGGSGKLKGRVFNNGYIDRWDKAPTQEYFSELRRVSRNQIIWGGNYFPLPPSRCIIVWDKVQPWENFSQVEIAWTSFDSPAQLFRFDNRTGDKIHPTQKPVELYSWLLRKYGSGGGRILDTHMGSQSSRIAAYMLGFDYVGCEIDEEYFRKGCERFDRECMGIHRLPNGKTIVEPSLF